MSKSSDKSSFSAFNLEAILDICIIYSRIFPLPLFFIEMRFASNVLVLALSFFKKRFCIYSRNSVAIFMLSETVPLMDSGIPRFMIIRLSRLERSHLSKCRISSVEPFNVISIGCGCHDPAHHMPQVQLFQRDIATYASSS